MKKIDLHVHTNISDGSETPENAVRHAAELGISAIAITDHDSTNAVKPARAEGEKLGVEIVAGIELGCGWHGREIHMLGYDLDTENEELRATLDWIVEDRNERNRKMVALMRADGIDIDLDALQAAHPDSIIGRPHFAMCLIQAGLAENILDAFDKFIDPGRKYYVRRNFLTVQQAAEKISAAGGKAVIAHPRQYCMDASQLDELFTRAKEAGVAGVECRYSGYSPEEVAHYEELAKSYGFCVTGGSDWHGRHKPHIEMGSGINGELSVSYDLLKKLRFFNPHEHVG